ncbi:MAG: hypothetical protein VB144_02340, partial [Clostridia bacterium]|nr:hypothetical protein [Clostridia bacterium]
MAECSRSLSASAIRWALESKHPTYQGYDIVGRLLWSAVQTGPGFGDWAASWHKYDALDRVEASWAYRQASTWDKTSYEYSLHFEKPTSMTMPGTGRPEPKHVY